ncbi:hypothetical protein F4859DRAFT_524455 [Xylaria cf. heliscus]|nr:hypothetical protein F4859DRAFT_524455 [Xylaria cf. heliscus]
MSDQNSQHHAATRARDESSGSTENQTEFITAQVSRINAQQIHSSNTYEDGQMVSIPARIGSEAQVLEELSRLPDDVEIGFSTVTLEDIMAMANLCVPRSIGIRNNIGTTPVGIAGCKICNGRHCPVECIHLNDDDISLFTSNGRAFRKWCPFHKRPHAMDDCKQKWLWLQDAEMVHKLLITESANAPPFATDLVSWPDIVEHKDMDLPWSAEHSHKMWTENMSPWLAEQATGPIESNRRRDPAITHRDTLKRLPHQTASGNAPQFSGPFALEELAIFAERLCHTHRSSEPRI